MALDFPTSPTNGQVYGAYVYDSSITAWRSKGVAQAATYVSDTAPSGAVQGDMWYRSTDGTTYVYYKDADTSQWVEIRSEIATSQIGLVPVKPTSVSVTSGSATVSGSGVISFSGVTDLQLNGVFTSAYQNYRAVFAFYASSTGELRQRYSVNGTVQTDANFGWAGNSANSAGTQGGYSGSGIDWGAGGGFQNSTGNLLISDISSPAINGTITRQNSSWGAWNGQWQAATFSMGYNNGQVVDGIRYYVTVGTMTGTVRIYGYN